MSWNKEIKGPILCSKYVIYNIYYYLLWLEFVFQLFYHILKTIHVEFLQNTTKYKRKTQQSTMTQH